MSNRNVAASFVPSRVARSLTMPLGMIVIAVLVALAGTAEAQDYPAATKAFGAGVQLFNKRQYAKAADQFKIAYDITKDPVLLFNMAEAYDKANKPALAVQYYRQYATAAPRAVDRQTVDKRVAFLAAKYKLPAPPAESITPPPAPRLPSQEKPATEVAQAPAATPGTPDKAPAATPEKAPAVAANEPTKAGATEPAGELGKPPLAAEKPATPASEVPKEAITIPAPAAADTEAPRATALASDKPSGLKITAWVGVATTVALLTTGAVMGLAAQERSDEISRRSIAADSTGQPPAFTADEQAKYNDLKGSGKTFNTVGIALMSASAATAVTSAILFIVDAKRAKSVEKHVRITPSFSPQGGGVAASIEF